MLNVGFFVKDDIVVAVHVFVKVWYQGHFNSLLEIIVHQVPRTRFDVIEVHIPHSQF